MIKYKEVKHELDKLKEIVYQENPDGIQMSKTHSIDGFFSLAKDAWYFILSEKENIVFGLLQWAVIGIMYYVWVQALDWILEEVWESKNESEQDAANLVLFLWSLVCVGIATLPIGLLTSCMSASLILRTEGRQSTIYECMKMALHHAWTVWIFSWYDGWWTVNRILSRLCRSKKRSERIEDRIDELKYQVWKFATLGFIPATMFGRGLLNSCKDCLLIIKSQFRDLAKLRIGYVLCCWIIGIAGYIGGLYFMFKCYSNIIGDTGEVSMYKFYIIFGVPLIFTLTIIMLILRPVYIISASKLYIRYTRESSIEAKLPQNAPKFISIFVAFIALCFVTGVALLYHDELGIDKFITEKIVENQTQSEN